MKKSKKIVFTLCLLAGSSIAVVAQTQTENKIQNNPIKVEATTETSTKVIPPSSLDVYQPNKTNEDWTNGQKPAFIDDKGEKFYLLSQPKKEEQSTNTPK